MLLLATALSLASPAAAECPKHYDRRDFHEAARSTYRHVIVPPSKLRTLRRIVRCQHSARSKRIVRFHLRRYKAAHAIRVRWAYFKSHPMPYCTWGHESGEGVPEWPPSARYTTPNSQGSGAYGKYQIMPSIWVANGGGASWAPLEQERVARNLYAARGTQPWSGCN